MVEELLAGSISVVSGEHRLVRRDGSSQWVSSKVTLVRDDGVEPVLVLDDVFAELDVSRRERLAAAIADAEQVLITAAVGADVPDFPAERRFRVDAGTATPALPSSRRLRRSWRRAGGGRAGPPRRPGAARWKRRAPTRPAGRGTGAWTACSPTELGRLPGGSGRGSGPPAPSGGARADAARLFTV